MVNATGEGESREKREMLNILTNVLCVLDTYQNTDTKSDCWNSWCVYACMYVFCV